MPDDTTAPVTAEDLRETLIETLIDSWKTGSFRSLRDSAARDVDTILAALAGDPGEMPERMVVKMRAHRLDSDGMHCICGEIVEDWDAHRAEAAMLLHSQDHAATVAHLTQAEAEVERLRAELAAVLDHDREAVRMLNAAEADLERLVALVAERNALKAAIAEQTQRTLNAAADKLYALPATDGAALKGPYWYRQGFTQAADLLRDWADYPAALAAPESPEDAPTEETDG